MNYTLHQLQIFRKIAETKSVTKAAEELHLTQPAVSIQLKNFQAQFDIPLTEIIGRNIYMTDFGKEIAVAAEKILEQVHNINYKRLAYQGALIGKLKISIVSTGKYVMPYFISGFINDNAGVELKMDVTNKSKVIESLANNEVDFALVSILPEKLNVEQVSLLKNKLYLVGNSTTPLKMKKSDLKAIGKLPLIFREEGSGTRQVMEKFFRDNDIPVLKRMELTSNEAVKQALLANLGYSIMPLIGIRNEIQNKELSIIPIKGLPIQTAWQLIWLKGKQHSPVASAFLKYISDNKQDILHDKFKWYEEY
ncbi:MAG: LysR family transcriptional regulator [Chitinophagales bacterium]|nr:LysR family transcriptional regulator [Chitinophagaceae bacterium]MCB9064141.1 LysR family transcriptional regulator [Chitinophagales bacterium]